MAYQRICRACKQTFTSLNSFKTHLTTSTDHNYCADCPDFKVFCTEDAIRAHCTAKGCSPIVAETLRGEAQTAGSPQEASFAASAGPRPRFNCDVCCATFGTKDALGEHRRSDQRHNWCMVCAKDFATPVALESHLSSKAHEQRDHGCPLCSQAFPTPSAMVHHIEEGCSGLTRKDVAMVVHSLKIQPSISTARGRGACKILPPVEIDKATEDAFNGTHYECALCNARFERLHSLNRHLTSGAHERKGFKCPGKKCGKKSRLASSMLQHIESGTCRITQLPEVEQYTRELTGQFSNYLKT
ncbi:hypothetical protein BDN72DRAFT_892376 [Pluteus cervinus]|uniref:Uncharacterized protein n=1 Tax=Pluteus cervinus TaxID=181527 RepID=A0ACD3BBZ1_9AGAR|nr:hypothetical protein BDN72DRAFT_892376 [Pluteus cervinus]